MKNGTAVLLFALALAVPAFCGQGGGTPPAVCPEPGSIILFGTLVAGVGGFAWFKKRPKGE